MLDVHLSEARCLALRARGCEASGHLIAERADGFCAGWCLMGSVVRQDNNGGLFDHEGLNSFLEVMELREVLVDARVIIGCALHNDALLGESHG